MTLGCKLQFAISFSKFSGKYKFSGHSLFVCVCKQEYGTKFLSRLLKASEEDKDTQGKNFRWDYHLCTAVRQEWLSSIPSYLGCLQYCSLTMQPAFLLWLLVYPFHAPSILRSGCHRMDWFRILSQPKCLLWLLLAQSSYAQNSEDTEMS